MNKLELEMSVNNLRFRKELCENLIKSGKSSLLLSRVAVTFNLLAAIYVICVGTAFAKGEKWGFVILEIVLATINVTLCVFNMKGIKKIKCDLEQREKDLKHLNADIKALEEMVAT